MIGARDWFKSVAAGQRPAGSAFMPLLEMIAPRVAGSTWQQMSSDPTAWSSALGQTAQLLGSSALTLGWDETLLAEACGVPLIWNEDRPQLGSRAEQFNTQAKSAGRLPALLETAQRLSQTARPERACVLAITGPATLARQVFAAKPEKPVLEQLKPVLVEVVEGLCQGRPECLVLRESGVSATGDVKPDLRRIYNTLKNIASYYGVMTALHLDGYADWQQDAARWTVLRIDHLLLGADAAGQLPQPACFEGWQSLGWPLSTSDAAASQARIEASTGSLDKNGVGVLFTTLPQAEPAIEALHGINAMLS
ncbi:MAG: hypothetical protein HY847_08730 [Betaproteobacteria bacterium]|nr:hypothetical protein [Betaproteobacteria bacterium]